MVAVPEPIESLSSVAVFTGSAPGNRTEYAEAMTALGTRLGEQRVRLVYGGARIGLMGRVADAAIAAGGEVVGVIPQGLVDKEIAHPGLTDLRVVTTMHERKLLMAELADGFILAPGGAGSLEEFFEVWTWQHLGIHAKPVGVLNTLGIWDPLLTSLSHLVDEGFIAAKFPAAVVVEQDPADLLDGLRRSRPPTDKWLGNGAGRSGT